MGKELIERLRKSARIGVSLPDPAREAADRIEELERELATTLSLLNYASDKALGTRRECDALLADNERLRDAGKLASASFGAFVSDEGWGHVLGAVANLQGRVEELERELECERIRLVACGVVALANTPDSAARAREMSPEYRSASLDDVIRAVDSEMALRQERDALLADNERLREALEHLVKGALSLPRFAGQEATEALAATPEQSLDALLDPYKAHIERLRDAGKLASASLGAFVSDEGWGQDDMDNMDYLDAVLAATPEQSLARLRNQVREECEQACKNWSLASSAADAIRDMKKPESTAQEEI